MYPYAASGTGLAAVIPPWAQAEDRLFDNLREPAMRARIRQELERPAGDWEAMGSRDPHSVMMSARSTGSDSKRYLSKYSLDTRPERNVKVPLRWAISWIRRARSARRAGSSIGMVGP